MAKKGKIIRNGIEYSGGGSSGDIMYLTQAEYDALPDTKLSDNVEYRITDASIEAAKASNISYDNSNSGLDANNVQGAVDTLTESLGGLIKKITVTGKTSTDGLLESSVVNLSATECTIIGTKLISYSGSNTSILITPYVYRTNNRLGLRLIQAESGGKCTGVTITVEILYIT